MNVRTRIPSKYFALSLVMVLSLGLEACTKAKLNNKGKARVLAVSGTLAITSVDPPWGTPFGGTQITIIGTGFKPTPTVTIGGETCQDVMFVSEVELRCTTPSHSLGSVDIVVINPDSMSAFLASSYAYVEHANPSAVLAGGGISFGTTVSVHSSIGEATDQIQLKGDDIQMLTGIQGVLYQP